MKTLIRTFFKTLRMVLGPFMLLKETLTQPKGIQRPPDMQAKVDAECQSLALYQFKTCPFCIKTRQEMRRLSLPIAQIDAQHEGPNRQALAAGSGHTKVPCLRIQNPDNSVQWLQDSEKIITYLRGRFT